MEYFKETQKGLDSILALLRCVKCSSLSREKIYTVYACNHKYCEKCIPKDLKRKKDEKCTLCHSEVKHQELIPDAFTTNLLHELQKLQTKLHELAEMNCKNAKAVAEDMDVDDGDDKDADMNNDLEEIEVDAANLNNILEDDAADVEKSTTVPDAVIMDNIFEDNAIDIGKSSVDNAIDMSKSSVDNAVDMDNKDEDVENFFKNDDEMGLEDDLIGLDPAIDDALESGKKVPVNEEKIDVVPVKDRIGEEAYGNHCGIESVEMDNNFDDFFQDPFESDDMIVATQIRPSAVKPKPKRIFTKNKEKEVVKAKDKVGTDKEKPSILIDIESESEHQEVKKTQPLIRPKKKRLPSVRRLNSSYTKESLTKKDNSQDKKQEHTTQFSEPLPLDTPKISTREDKLVDFENNGQQNSDGNKIVQTQLRKSLTAVKPKNIFFTSKRKTSDDSNAKTDTGKDAVEDILIDDNDFLNEILNPPKPGRVPFKPLKTYTKSSKPKTKPRLNLHDSDSDADFFNTPQPVQKKVDHQPPDLTPYTNKSYSPVRKRMKVKKMSLKGENENTDEDSKGEKVFDFQAKSPSPPPLTPYPIVAANDKKESIANSRSSKRKRTSVGPVGLISSTKSISSISSATVKTTATKASTSKSRSSSRTSASGKTFLPTIKKNSILSTPTSKVGRRRIISAATTCDSPGSSVSIPSSCSSLTPGGAKRNSKGETLLHVAARKGDIKKVEELITSGIEIDAVDYNGYTALHEAISSRSKLGNNFEVAKILCNAGCDVNVPAGDFKETPLHEACRLGLRPIVELLLSHKASPNIRNTAGSLARDLTPSESIKNLMDSVSKPREEVNQSSQEAEDDPAVLKIQFERALVFFAYGVPQQIVKECQNGLKLKIANELRKEVTHIVFKVLPHAHVPFGLEYLYGLMTGSWMVSDTWIGDSLKQGTFVSPRNYEILGCDPSTRPDCNFLNSDEAPRRARVNKERGNPGLFHGMNFLLYKSTVFAKLTKKDLGKLILTGNGVVINREPNPDAVDPMENPIRFHAQDANSKLVLTSHVILFDRSNEPTKKLNMEHVKSLNIKWLIDSSLNFKLLDPEDYVN